MKNTLFTGIAGENLSGIAHHLGRGVQYRSSARSRAALGIGMPLLNKDGGEKYHCRTLRRPSLLQVYYFK